MILRYTPRARQDLYEIKNYVKNELANPQAAARIVERILKGCSNLKSNPYLGLDLSSKIGQKTDLRYLILSNYIAIYRVENNLVSIIRVMDGRTDYLRYLLPDIWFICSICEQSIIEPHKKRKGFSDVAEKADRSLGKYLIKKQTLHLTLLVECSVLYFIEKKF